MRWTNWLWVLFALAFFSACQQSVGYDEKFVKLYAELRVATQEFGLIHEDSRRMRLQILQHHGYSLARFDSAVQVLEKHPELWQAFQRDLNAELDRMKPQPAFSSSKGLSSSSQKNARSSSSGAPIKKKKRQ